MLADLFKISSLPEILNLDEQAHKPRNLTRYRSKLAGPRVGIQVKVKL